VISYEGRTLPAFAKSANIVSKFPALSRTVTVNLFSAFSSERGTTATLTYLSRHKASVFPSASYIQRMSGTRMLSMIFRTYAFCGSPHGPLFFASPWLCKSPRPGPLILTSMSYQASAVWKTDYGFPHAISSNSIPLDIDGSVAFMTQECDGANASSDKFSHRDGGSSERSRGSTYRTHRKALPPTCRERTSKPLRKPANVTALSVKLRAVHGLFAITRVLSCILQSHLPPHKPCLRCYARVQQL
jgi:hypothetical protein